MVRRFDVDERMGFKERARGKEVLYANVQFAT
jgi:hypothetical protein